MTVMFSRCAVKIKINYLVISQHKINRIAIKLILLGGRKGETRHATINRCYRGNNLENRQLFVIRHDPFVCFWGRYLNRNESAS